MKHRLIKAVLEDNVIMNWSTLQKCTLLLVLACGTHIIWMLWKGFILLHPALQDFMYLPLLKLSFRIDLISFVLLMALIYPTVYYRDHCQVKLLIPWISIGYFTAILCFNSYLIGTLSPATMIGYVSIVGVGLILFQRRFVYVTLIPASIVLLVCTGLSTLHLIPYAPLFSLSSLGTSVFTQPLWVLSMLFFSLPILVTCWLLFEILLTQWRNRETYIQQLSQIDPLTSLLNRRSINLCLKNLHQQHAQNLCYAIILLDLDHFKQVNDRYGHHVGDEVLIEVANCLTRNLRQQDYVGRFGGEEFIILLPCTPLEQARTIAERCRIAIQKIPVFTEDHISFHISASFGIAVSNLHDDPKQLLSQADRALYAVKAAGRNQVCSFLDLPQSAG